MWCESNSSLGGFTIYFCLGDAMIACFGGGMGIYRWILLPVEREYALFIIHETRTHSTKRPISISPPCLFPTIGLHYAFAASLWRGAPDSTLSASASEKWQFVVCQAATRGMWLLLICSFNCTSYVAWKRNRTNLSHPYLSRSAARYGISS